MLIDPAPDTRTTHGHRAVEIRAQILAKSWSFHPWPSGRSRGAPGRAPFPASLRSIHFHTSRRTLGDIFDCTSSTSRPTAVFNFDSENRALPFRPLEFVRRPDRRGRPSSPSSFHRRHSPTPMARRARFLIPVHGLPAPRRHLSCVTLPCGTNLGDEALLPRRRGYDSET